MHKPARKQGRYARLRATSTLNRRCPGFRVSPLLTRGLVHFCLRVACAFSPHSTASQVDRLKRPDPYTEFYTDPPLILDCRPSVSGTGSKRLRDFQVQAAITRD